MLLVCSPYRAMPIQPRSRSPPNQEREGEASSRSNRSSRPSRRLRYGTKHPEENAAGSVLGLKKEAAEAQAGRFWASRPENGQLPVGFGKSVISGERPAGESGARPGR